MSRAFERAPIEAVVGDGGDLRADEDDDARDRPHHVLVLAAVRLAQRRKERLRGTACQTALNGCSAALVQQRRQTARCWLRWMLRPMCA